MLRLKLLLLEIMHTEQELRIEVLVNGGGGEAG